MAAIFICPYCNHEDEQMHEFCKNCGRKLKKRGILGLFVIFVLLLLIYPILQNTGVYVDVERDRLVEKPYYTLKEIIVTEPAEKEVCINRGFRYSTLGGNVDSLGDYVRPNLILNNLESRGGTYIVNFSYMDEKKYPYRIYGGENLAQMFESGNITYNDAEFYSDTYLFYLEPGETILIKNLTKSKNNKTNYWAIADINEPEFLDCRKETEYVNKTQNRTFTELQKTTEKTSVKEYRKISEIIGVNNFFEWIIIIFLLLLIFMLIIKIIDEQRVKKREYSA